MDWTLFKSMLSMDSTSGKEREMALWLNEHLEAPSKQLMEVGDGTLNLLLTWGQPTVVFCTHMDTVPPYIAPQFPEGILSGETPFASLTPAPPTASWTFPAGTSSAVNIQQSAGPSPYPCAGVHMSSGECTLRDGGVIYGRGACDAKGQIFAMYTACKELEAQGCGGFGLLLLAGEETGSWGAKAFSKTDFKAPYLIVGEPTENKMVSASKGTLSYDLKFTGEAFHSGYPQFGVSAIDLFNQFYNKLKAQDFGLDPVLGETTWNIGLLHSDNPQNILSPELTCRLYFRTTFVSHEKVQAWMANAPKMVLPDASLRDPVRANASGSTTLSALAIQARGGDTPARYLTLDGFPSGPVAFGSDAPHLTGFTHKAICGPGSITVAHRDNEQVLVCDLETAVAQYKEMCREMQNAYNQ